MKKKIAIIESTSTTHYNLINGITKLFLYMNFDVNIYINQDVYDYLLEIFEDEKITKAKVNKINFTNKTEIKSMESDINSKADIVFIMTTESGILMYNGLKFKCKQFILIHDINLWFNPKFKFFEIKERIRHQIRKNIFKKLSGCIVLSDPMKDYLSTFIKNPILFIPGKFYNEEKTIKNEEETDKITITIPGGVNENRRDYESVLNAICEVPNDKYKLILLGTLTESTEYGNKIKAMCDNLISRGYEIDYYTKYVSEKEFIQIMKATDTILSPTCTYFKNDYSMEQYGKSKITGSICDIVGYQKVPIIVESLADFLPFKKGILTYSSKEDLIQILGELNKTKLNQLHSELLLELEQFSIPNIAKTLQPQLQCLFNQNL
jgi:hypothetical protein